jgi:hypothetical protein
LFITVQSFKSHRILQKHPQMKCINPTQNNVIYDNIHKYFNTSSWIYLFLIATNNVWEICNCTYFHQYDHHHFKLNKYDRKKLRQQTKIHYLNRKIKKKIFNLGSVDLSCTWQTRRKQFRSGWGQNNNHPLKKNLKKERFNNFRLVKFLFRWWVGGWGWRELLYTENLFEKPIPLSTGTWRMDPYTVPTPFLRCPNIHMYSNINISFFI